MHLAKKTLVQSAEIARERKDRSNLTDRQCLFSQRLLRFARNFQR